MAWSADKILSTLKKLHSAGNNISYNAMQKKMQPLVSAAAYHFGSYRDAVRKAGIEYADITRRPRWTRESIIAQIKTAYKKGQDLNWAKVTGRGDELARAAFSSLQPRLFGSWRKALTAAGIDPVKVSRYQAWTKENIVDAIKDLKKKGKPLSSGKLQAGNPGLYAAAVRYFGTYDDALKAANVDPGKVRLRISWDKDEVLTRMKAAAKSGEVTTTALRRDNPALYGAATRLFGSVKTARKAAGVN